MRSPALALSLMLLGCPRPTAPPSPLSPPATQPVAEAGTVTFVVLGDNDLHGALDGRTFNQTLADGKPYAMKVGGAEYISAYYSRLREAHPNRVILLAGGDIFQGTMLSNNYEGAPVLEFLNYLGYDAAALGNHEFDYGPVGPLSVPQSPDDDPVGALKQLLEQSRFPFLSANLKERATGKPPSWARFAPSTLIEREGVKIGVLGLSTESTPTTTQPPNVVGLEFLPLALATQQAAEELRRQGAEIVLVVSHAGTECKDLKNPLDESSCDQNEEIPRLLHALPPNTVDAVVGGHTHQFVANFIAGTPVIESGSNGTAFGRIELTFDKKTRTLLRDKTKILPPQMVCREVFVGTGACDSAAARRSPDGKTEPATFLGAPIVPDTKLTELLKARRAEVEVFMREPIGEVARPINRAEKGESAMGDFVTDLMREATLHDPSLPDADFAVQNSGGLRADLSAGPLTYGEIFEVLPFENILVVMKLKGDQVKEIFDLALKDGRVFQVSGLRVIYSSTPKAGKTPKEKFDFDDYDHSVKRIETAAGKPIDPKKTYTVVWNDFLANGGNGMKVLMDKLPPGAVTRHYNATLRDAVVSRIKAKKEPLNPDSAPLLDPKRPRLVFEAQK